LDIIS